MSDSLKESLEGAGIGLLGGLVIGISEAEWLRIAIALALITYAGNFLRGNTTGSPGNSLRIAFTGIGAFYAILIGLYINGQHLFDQTPKKTIDEWINAGYSPQQSRFLYLKQMEKGFQKKQSDPAETQLLKKVLSIPGTEVDKPVPDSVSSN